jgi:hypothetical protein
MRRPAAATALAAAGCGYGTDRGYGAGCGHGAGCGYVTGFSSAAGKIGTVTELSQSIALIAPYSHQ